MPTDTSKEPALSLDDARGKIIKHCLCQRWDSLAYVVQRVRPLLVRRGDDELPTAQTASVEACCQL